VDFTSNLGQRRILRIGIAPGGVQARIRKLTAFFLVQLSNFKKNSGENFLIEFCVSRRRQRRILPLQPSRGIDECPALFSKSGTGEAVYAGLELLHLVVGDA